MSSDGFIAVACVCVIYRYAKTVSDLKDAERRLLTAEGQISDLQARVTDAVNQKKHAETELNVCTHSSFIVCK